MKSDFSQMRPSRFRFDYERGAIRWDLIVNEFKQMGLGLIDRIIDYERNQYIRTVYDDRRPTRIRPSDSHGSKRKTFSKHRDLYHIGGFKGGARGPSSVVTN